MRLISVSALLVLGAASSVLAEQDLCSIVHDTSKSIMRARQDGVPIPDVMARWDDPKIGDLRDLFKALTVEAYERPRYPIEDLQREAVDTFANDNYLACYKARNKQTE